MTRETTKPLDPLAAFVADPIQRRGFLAQLDQSLLDPDVQGWRTDTVRVLRAILADREAKLAEKDAEFARMENAWRRKVDSVRRQEDGHHKAQAAAEAKLREVEALTSEHGRFELEDCSVGYVLDKLHAILTRPSTTTASEEPK